MRKFYYVYELLDEEGVPFYVGKGSGKRMFMHEKQVWKYRTRSQCKDDKERKIFDMQEGCRDVGYRIVFRTNDEVEAFAMERLCISKNHSLLNSRKGTYPAIQDSFRRKMRDVWPNR